MAKRMHRQEGFTLIELMIVILIIGILVGIAVPVFLSARSSADSKACLSNQRNFLTAVDISAADQDVYPATLEIWQGTNDVYFQGNLPECPGKGGIVITGWGVDSRPQTKCMDGDKELHGSPGVE